ncbi:MAG TPA: CocE/NonD family hydrolase, partial [Actinomycetota bacterium]|nr:CocE/NonD family hydrolase [Actinomycetota bacterium]
MRKRHLVIALSGLMSVVLVSPADARLSSASDSPVAVDAPGLERSTTATELAEARHVRFPSFDGTVLDGTLLLPELPAGAKAPVVLELEPYFGNVYPHHDDPSLWDEPEHIVHFMRLVREGYAIALFSMRGTGNSEGCLDLMGSREHRDAVALIEWLAEQPWSNGRVGMVSHSYGTAA